LVKPTKKWHTAESPAVTITNPVSKFRAKRKFTINTSASDNTIKVEFYINSMRVGIDTTAPFAFKVDRLPKGNYTIFARAFDSKNEHTTSAPVILNIGTKTTVY
jgi:hypothetical protein